MKFPSSSEYGQALFREAARYLEDAKYLQLGSRPASSVAFSIKAVEFSMKALAAHQNALGWWPDLLRSHRPIRDGKGRHILRELIQALDTVDPGVVADGESVENLNSVQVGEKSYQTDQLENPEYPWFNAVPAHGPIGMVVPSDHFTDARAAEEYNRALRFARAAQGIDQDLSAIALPTPI
jgi:HEPN domain-containing protein